MSASEFRTASSESKEATATPPRNSLGDRTVLDALPAFLVVVDGDRRVLDWNPAAARTLGMATGAPLGMPVRQLNPSWNLDSDDAISRAFATGAPLRVDDVAYTRPDGQEGILGLTVIPVDSQAGGGELACLLMGSDVTARRLLESKLAQSQRMESIGQLAAGIAHEINTPIQYVGDNTRFLGDVFSTLAPLLHSLRELAEGIQLDDAPARLDELVRLAADADLAFVCDEVPLALKQSEEGLARVASIVRAMKQFSHPGSDDKIHTDLNQAIQNTITVSRNEWKYVAEMHTDLDPDLPSVPCLPQEFNQVTLNLIVNAAHAIRDLSRPEGAAKGTITVCTRRTDQWAELTICDTGGGIPLEHRARVFDPFFTTKRIGEGTGQGLAIAYNVVVERHRGEIFFDTEEGQGTTFTVRLPLMATADQASLED